MEIHHAKLATTVADPRECPETTKPEYAFFGRSNVGKSSLINMLTGRKSLAHTSVTPGKTKTINHYLIDEKWFLVDLPGYGYAKVSKTDREKWIGYTSQYLTSRKNLVAVFILLDMRHPLQQEDAKWLSFLGKNGIPVVRLFTKSDKLKNVERDKMMKLHNKALEKTWEEPPPFIITSSVKKSGRSKILDVIEDYNEQYFEYLNQQD